MTIKQLRKLLKRYPPYADVVFPLGHTFTEEIKVTQKDAGHPIVLISPVKSQ